MKIIASAKAIGFLDYEEDIPFSEFLKTENRDTVLRDIFTSIEHQFDEQRVRTKDAYNACLYRPTAEQLADDVVLGAENPCEIIRVAKDWNTVICQQALDAIQGAKPLLEKGDMDNSDTHKLSCAARMVDNHWFWFADFATYIESKEVRYPVFKTLLREDDLKDIIANPGQYILITVYPK